MYYIMPAGMVPGYHLTNLFSRLPIHGFTMNGEGWQATKRLNTKVKKPMQFIY